MSELFKLEFDAASGVLVIGFGVQASNAEIVPFVEARLAELKKAGGFMGPLLKINGPASLPVAFVLAHCVNHLFGAVAVFDPKLSGYVVAVSHNPEYTLGTVIPA